ncbi:MAG: hypothetical protein ACOYKZ_08160 [Chlamydiia bacterium]
MRIPEWICSPVYPEVQGHPDTSDEAILNARLQVDRLHRLDLKLVVLAIAAGTSLDLTILAAVLSWPWLGLLTWVSIFPLACPQILARIGTTNQRPVQAASPMMGLSVVLQAFVACYALSVLTTGAAPVLVVLLVSLGCQLGYLWARVRAERALLQAMTTPEPRDLDKVSLRRSLLTDLHSEPTENLAVAPARVVARDIVPSPGHEASGSSHSLVDTGRQGSSALSLVGALNLDGIREQILSYLAPHDQVGLKGTSKRTYAAVNAVAGQQISALPGGLVSAAGSATMAMNTLLQNMIYRTCLVSLPHIEEGLFDEHPSEALALNDLQRVRENRKALCSVDRWDMGNAWRSVCMEHPALLRWVADMAGAGNRYEVMNWMGLLWNFLLEGYPEGTRNPPPISHLWASIQHHAEQQLHSAWDRKTLLQDRAAPVEGKEGRFRAFEEELAWREKELDTLQSLVTNWARIAYVAQLRLRATTEEVEGNPSNANSSEASSSEMRLCKPAPIRPLSRECGEAAGDLRYFAWPVWDDKFLREDPPWLLGLFPRRKLALQAEVRSGEEPDMIDILSVLLGFAVPPGPGHDDKLIHLLIEEYSQRLLSSAYCLGRAGWMSRLRTVGPNSYAEGLLEDELGENHANPRWAAADQRFEELVLTPLLAGLPTDVAFAVRERMRHGFEELL